jgi:hypothetical protein
MDTISKTDPKENARSVDRRQFLGAMITATAGVAFAAAGVPDALGATPPTPQGTQYMPIGNGAYELYQIVNGKKIVFARVAPDGLLPGSVFGTYVGETRGGFTVAVPKISGTVDVQLAPDTSVQAGGEERLADLSLLNLGDDLSVGTTLDSNGKRIAEYVRANVLMGHTKISAVSGNTVTGVPVDRGLNPVAGRPSIKLVVGPFMKMPGPAPASGEYWRYFATSSSPDNPEQIWAHDLYEIVTS